MTIGKLITMVLGKRPIGGKTCTIEQGGEVMKRLSLVILMFILLFPLGSLAGDMSETVSEGSGDTIYAPNMKATLNQGFEDGVMPPAGWSVHVTNPDKTWRIDSYDPHGGVYYAAVYYDPDLVRQEEVIYSSQLVPASDLSLSFWSLGSIYWCRDNYDNCDFKVYVDADNTWGNGNEQYVYTVDADWTDDYTYVHTSLNLSAYATGSPLYIAFVYTGEDGDVVGLDDIEITSDGGGGGSCQEDDTGALDIKSSSGAPGGTVSIAVRVQNAPNQVSALGFDLSFPNSVLTYTGFTKGSSVESWSQFNATDQGGGLLRVGGFTTKNEISAGTSATLVYLKFTVAGGCEGGHKLDFQKVVDDIGNWTHSHGCFDCTFTCDINGDGEITPADALCAFQTYMANCPTECGPCEQIQCDVTQNGQCTPDDAFEIFKAYIGRPSVCSAQ